MSCSIRNCGAPDEESCVALVEKQIAAALNKQPALAAQYLKPFCDLTSRLTKPGGSVSLIVTKQDSVAIKKVDLEAKNVGNDNKPIKITVITITFSRDVTIQANIKNPKYSELEVKLVKSNRLECTAQGYIVDADSLLRLSPQYCQNHDGDWKTNNCGLVLSLPRPQPQVSEGQVLDNIKNEIKESLNKKFKPVCHWTDFIDTEFTDSSIFTAVLKNQDRVFDLKFGWGPEANVKKGPRHLTSVTIAVDVLGDSKKAFLPDSYLKVQYQGRQCYQLIKGDLIDANTFFDLSDAASNLADRYFVGKCVLVYLIHFVDDDKPAPARRAPPLVLDYGGLSNKEDTTGDHDTDASDTEDEDTDDETSKPKFRSMNPSVAVFKVLG